MNSIYFQISLLAVFISSYTSNDKDQFTALKSLETNRHPVPEIIREKGAEISEFVFKHILCYQYSDGEGNTVDYEIAYQPQTGMMYVILNGTLPMTEGILIYPDGTYNILGQNEDGNKINFIFKNGKDLVVELNDEEGVSYPKEHPYTNYQLNEGNALVYRDGIKGSYESIKSTLYSITFDRTSETLNLYLTDAFPMLNARLLYGLAHLPGDAGTFFKPFGELWNISSQQWPTLISGKNYSLEMTCFGATDYHVNPALYIQ